LGVGLFYGWATFGLSQQISGFLLLDRCHIFPLYLSYQNYSSFNSDFYEGIHCNIFIFSNGGHPEMKEFSVIIERDEDGYYVASVPSLRGCHTQAKSMDTLMKRIKEAIELCLEVERPVSNEFIGVQKVAVN
jgi:predicted RNase H-like HicB family nuclease